MTHTLYSFRRCPYAMRARLALASAAQPVELREIVLRDKPAAFLATSPSATVPCLQTAEQVIDESLDIMVWALRRNDPEQWLAMPETGWGWIAKADGPFKQALDRTKYASRYPDEDATEQRQKAAGFLSDLDQTIDRWIFTEASLADYAILPFVRQFAFIDKPWFDQQPWPHLQSWLDRFISSSRFEAIMHKYPQWQDGDAATLFPEAPTKR